MVEVVSDESHDEGGEDTLIGGVNVCKGCAGWGADIVTAAALALVIRFKVNSALLILGGGFLGIAYRVLIG